VSQQAQCILMHMSTGYLASYHLLFIQNGKINLTLDGNVNALYVCVDSSSVQYNLSSIVGLLQLKAHIANIEQPLLL
jgi:hypothetical protein